MPDPGLPEAVVKGSAVAMAVFAGARALLSLARRWGLSDSLATAEAAYRQVLKGEMDELRKRLSVAEARVDELLAELRKAEDAAIEERRARARLEDEVAKLHHELAGILGPDRDRVLTDTGSFIRDPFGALKEKPK